MPSRLQLNILPCRLRLGVSPKLWNVLITKQKNKCAICKINFESSGSGWFSRPNIDHDHKTNKLRGLLCGACNTGLGYLRDNTTILKNAIKYLEHPTINLQVVPLPRHPRLKKPLKKIKLTPIPLAIRFHKPRPKRINYPKQKTTKCLKIDRSWVSKVINSNKHS
jgi:hypothetical protein